MATHNDGSIPFGIPVTVTIGGQVYVVEDFSPDLASTVIERRSGLGAMTGRVVIDDQPPDISRSRGWTGSMTLQRATTTSPMPAVGAQVAFSDADYANDLGFAAEDGTAIRVTGVSASQSQTTAHTFTISVAGVLDF